MRAFLKEFKLPTWRFSPIILVTITTFSLMSCGFFGDDPKPEQSSSSVEQSSSSAQPIDSNRVEIEYSDTLEVDDSLHYFAKTGENWYIGLLPKGSVIHISVQSKRIGDAAELAIFNELGAQHWPTEALPDSTYQNFFTASKTSLLQNHIIVTDSGHFYLNFQEFATSTKDTLGDSLLISLRIDTAYYQFVGDTSKQNIDLQKVVLGCFPLRNGEDSVTLQFSAGAGKRLTLNAQGSRLSQLDLYEGKSKIASSESPLQKQMLPQDTTTWNLAIHTIIPSWNSGNYAFFQVQATSINLGQGEYLAKADTLKTIGDTTIFVRTGNEFSGWDVQHDQYLLLPNLPSGKNIQLYYSMQGMANVIRLVRLLDSTGKAIDTLGTPLSYSWSNATPLTFSVPKTGKYFMQYIGIGQSSTYWTDPSFTLTFKTLIRIPGSLTSWNFPLNDFNMTGGTQYPLNDLIDQINVLPSGSSTNYILRLARASRQYLQDSLDIYLNSQGLPAPESDYLFSNWVIPAENQTNSVKLLIESVADPQQVDTCLIYITP